jgi:hypothetical protein
MSLSSVYLWLKTCVFRNDRFQLVFKLKTTRLKIPALLSHNLFKIWGSDWCVQSCGSTQLKYERTERKRTGHANIIFPERETKILLYVTCRITCVNLRECCRLFQLGYLSSFWYCASDFFYLHTFPGRITHNQTRNTVFARSQTHTINKQNKLPLTLRCLPISRNVM